MISVPCSEQELVKFQLQHDVYSFNDIIDAMTLGIDGTDAWLVKNWTWLKNHFNLELRCFVSKDICIIHQNQLIWRFYPHDDVYNRALELLESKS